MRTGPVNSLGQSVVDTLIEDPGQHFGPRMVGHFGSFSILGRCLIAKLESFSYLRLEYDFLPEWGVWGKDSPPT
jgi:hypothetical protein